VPSASEAEGVLPADSWPGAPELGCEFCDIVAGSVPRRTRHEDSDLLVIHNQLTWAPVMLLILPKQHMGQQEFWGSSLFARAAKLAVELGEEDCPGGYRLLSNIGPDALQTQAHGHLHIIGGTALGLYLSSRLVAWPYGKSDVPQGA
jgi:histidine triad (HIT) family protein